MIGHDGMFIMFVFLLWLGNSLVWPQKLSNICQSFNGNNLFGIWFHFACGCKCKWFYPWWSLISRTGKKLRHGLLDSGWGFMEEKLLSAIFAGPIPKKLACSTVASWTLAASVDLIMTNTERQWRRFPNLERNSSRATRSNWRLPSGLVLTCDDIFEW